MLLQATNPMPPPTSLRGISGSLSRDGAMPWPAPAPLGPFAEATWRQPDFGDGTGDSGAPVLVSRWSDEASEPRRAEAVNPADRYVLSIALRRTRIRLTSGSSEVFNDVMAVGTVHVTAPSEPVAAEFRGPCDFVHLYVDDAWLDGCGAATDPGGSDLNGLVVRDHLAGQLARTLTDDAHARDPAYAESITRTVLLRLVVLKAPPATVCALPKWRLRRVQEYLDANLAETITLADLAGVAGLSRSYFAAQFRATTGCRPHDYVVEQRIERAKSMLAAADTPIAQVALDVGFQTQAHFSTVFKRLTATSPARWRQMQRNRD